MSTASTTPAVTVARAFAVLCILSGLFIVGVELVGGVGMALVGVGLMIPAIGTQARRWIDAR